MAAWKVYVQFLIRKHQIRVEGLCTDFDFQQHQDKDFCICPGANCGVEGCFLTLT